MTNIVEYTVLLRGKFVPASLYKSVRKQVEKRAPELALGIKYSHRMICGEEFWTGLHNQKTVAGQIMADLVERQLVPYRFASNRDARPLWYWLNP